MAVLPTTFRRADDVSSDLAGDRAIVLDVSGTELITLNPVGTIIWQLLEGGPSTVDAATDHLAAQFTSVPREQLLADVTDFVGSLLAAGLIVPADAAG